MSRISLQRPSLNTSTRSTRGAQTTERYLLVTHLHDFVRETNVTKEEWMMTVQFLTKVGQTYTNVRQEFILLSDILGISALVDSINNPPVHSSTGNTVLGPFFTEDAHDIPHGESIASEGKGEYMYLEGRILEIQGKPIPNAKIKTWETDDNGLYDTQYEGCGHTDCQGRLISRVDGSFEYRAVVPAAYPIPGDGPVGDLLNSLGRHNFRPAHLHMMITAPGFEALITALYVDGDKYLKTDAVFGVKKSLIVNLAEVISDEEARAKGFKKGPFKYLEHDFVLVRTAEGKHARTGRRAKTMIPRNTASHPDSFMQHSESKAV